MSVLRDNLQWNCSSGQQKVSVLKRCPSYMCPSCLIEVILQEMTNVLPGQVKVSVLKRVRLMRCPSEEVLLYTFRVSSKIQNGVSFIFVPCRYILPVFSRQLHIATLHYTTVVHCQYHLSKRCIIPVENKVPSIKFESKSIFTLHSLQ